MSATPVSSSGCGNKISMRSEFVNYCALRGAFCAVCGPVSQSINWPAAAADLLLHSMLSSPRYHRIIIMDFDFSSTSLRAIDCHEKVTILRDIDLYSAGAAADVYRAVCTAADAGTSVQGEVPNELGVGVVLYSLSELLLVMGLRRTKGLLQNLFEWQQQEKQLRSFINVVHESLHSPRVIASLEELFPVWAHVLPNNGLLAADVHCEVQTVRRAVTTGRVVECIEMFGDPPTHATAAAHSDGIDALLRLFLLKARLLDDQQYEEEELEEVTAASGAELLRVALAADGQEHTDASSSTRKKHEATQEQLPQRRLITFDSADPEFDEDSDPDADLDL